VIFLKQIVLPGELISEKEENMPNTFTDEGKTYSFITGMFDAATKRVVPLEGLWFPRKGDVIVGIISKAGRKDMYNLDIGHFMSGMLIEKFPKFEMKVGDIVEAEVDRVENKRIVQLSRPRLLNGGIIITIGPTKVHRVIGKSDTMITQIAEMTKCGIVVGENGLIWIKGGDTALAIEAIRLVESAAHVSGLTEIIKIMLKEKTR
jgi:exosome complex component RRP4